MANEFVVRHGLIIKEIPTGSSETDILLKDSSNKIITRTLIDLGGFSGYSAYSGQSGYSAYSGISGYSSFSGYSAYSGQSAYSGFSGYSSYSGVSGYSAFSGYSSYSGQSGYSAYSGISGYSSYSGISGYSGVSGYSSYSGISGYSGVSGYSSYSGISGYSGVSGYSSYSGISGYSAFSGYSSYSGISGYSSYSGISGYSSYSGISGYSSYSGISGYSAFSGYSSYSGKSGYSSYSGVSGYSAFSGYSGFSGYSSYSGISGYSAFSGYSGFSGYSSYSGISGYSAYSGISGYSAFSGYSAYSGISGYSSFSGYSSYSGKSGYSGFSGYSSYSGISGYSAFSGYSAYSGISGYSSFSGYSAYSGFSGYSAFSGYSSYSGFSGYSSYSGKSGYSSYSGWSGYSSYSGYSGIQPFTRDNTTGFIYPTTLTDKFGIGLTDVSSQLTIMSSGSGTTVMDIVGFNDELFSITDVVTDDILIVNDISGSALFTVNSDTTSTVHGDLIVTDEVYLSGLTSGSTEMTKSLVIDSDGKIYYRDITSFSGYSGTSGYSGYSGISGYSGPSFLESGSADGQMLFWSSEKAMYLYTDVSELVWEDAKKYLGIATGSPGTWLHIAKDAEVARFGTGTNTPVHVRFASDGTTNRAMFGYDGAYAVVQGGNTKGIEFNVNNNTFGTGTAMIIMPDGKVGIGVTSPDTLLHITQSFKYQDGFEGTNKVLVSDTVGKAKWENLSEFIIENGTLQGQLLYWNAVGDPPLWTAAVTESLFFNATNKSLTINTLLVNSNGYSELFSTYNPMGGAGCNIWIGGGGLNSSGDGLNYGSYNTSLGHDALRDNTSGRYNTAVGVNALQLNAAGYQNIAVGFDALQLNTVGYNNSAMGIYALYRNDEGHSNVAIGFNAAFQNTIGYQNIGIGRGALYNNYAGNNNIGIGYQAGFNLGFDSGSKNIAIGYQAGRDVSGSSLNNIFIGPDAGYHTNQKCDLTGSLALGANTYTTNNYQFVYGGTEVLTHSFQAGNVGIGTLDPGSYKLNVVGSQRIELGEDVNGFVVFDNPDATTLIRIDSDNNYILLSEGTNAYEGIIGIGTPTPSHKLEVHGNMWVETPALDTTAFVVGSGLGEDPNYYIRVNTTTHYVSLYNTLYASSTQVCIGGSSPAASARLDVEGVNGIAGIYFNDSSPTNVTYKLYNKDGDLYWNGSPISGSGGGGSVSGNGTIGFIPKYITTSTVGNSVIFQSGSSNRIGINTISDLAGALQIGSSPTTPAEGLWFGSDTNLYRYTTNGLKTDSQLWISGSSNPQLLISAKAGNQAFSIYKGTSTTPIFYITSEGHINVGSGTVSADCTIYRSGSNIIGTYNGDSWLIGGDPGYIFPSATGSSAQCILWKDENNAKTLQWVRYPKGTANKIMYFDGTNNYWTTSSNMSWDETSLNITGYIYTTETAGSTIKNSNTPSLTNPVLQLLSTAASSTTGGGYLFVGNDDGAAMESGSRLGSITFTGAENTNHSLKSGASINGIAAENWSSSNHSTNLRFDVFNGTNVIQALLLYYDGKSRFYGNVTAPNFILSSDKNLKTNIEAIPCGSLDIHYKQFEFKSNPNDIRYGVIAQDIIDKCPELVIGEEGNYSVKYIDLLIREIASIKERLSNLENKVYGNSR